MMQDSSLTFDNFIETSSNRFALQGCVKFAQLSFKIPPFIFLYGASGTGKTHLLHAIVNYARENYNEANVVITSAEEYTSNLIKAIRKDEMTVFREKYRKLDLLLVDGIEMFSGKEYTQEEFTHSFNDILSSKGRILATSGLPPSQLARINQALISRVLMGLVLELKTPPKDEISLILSQKYHNLINPIPEELLELASNCASGDVRRAEGIVSKILFHYSINNRYPGTQEVINWGNEILEHNSSVTRSIEFPPGYQDAGISVLTYFSHVLKVKYPGLKVRVKFEQEGLNLRMIVYTPSGQKEKIEKTLEEYGMVVTGKLRVETFLEDPFEVMALKNKLEIVNLELRQAGQLLDLTRDSSQQRIESLEFQINKLHSLIESGLQSGTIVFGAITKMAESKKTTYNLSNAKFGGGFAADEALQIGGTFVDLTSANNLTVAAQQIQDLLKQLQDQGISEEDAQQQIARDLMEQSETNPTVMGKLVKWGQSLADTAGKTTVSEAAKGVVKLALQMSGIPLP